jgi:hypothetical protein
MPQLRMKFSIVMQVELKCNYKTENISTESNVSSKVLSEH